MRMKLMGASVLAIVLAGPAAAQDSTWTWHRTIPAGQALRIEAIQGDVSATPASGGDVEVIARITGRSSDDHRARINVVERAGGVTICAVHEDSNDCDSNGHRHRNGERDDRVDFEVRVPRGVEFNGRSVSGDVTATGLTAEASAASVSGDVYVETAGIANGSSVSGDVHLKMGRADWEGTLKLSSVSGDVIVEIAGDLNTTVDFSTVSGEMESDWPITLKSSGSHRGVTGTIGTGGRKLTVSTVSGDVELRKAD